MRYGIYTLDDVTVLGKTVLCRIDIDQSIARKSGKLRSTRRIEACIPTILELADRGARVVLLAHQGSDTVYKKFFSTEPHAQVLKDMTGRKILWIDDVCGPTARDAIKNLQNGEILLLDNVRFLAEEQISFEINVRLTQEQQAQTLLVRKLAPLADLYVCDAFALADRSQPSLCGFEHVLPSVMGRSFEQEYCTISHLMETPDRPCTFVMGGAKVSDSFSIMRTSLEKGIADTILTGGLVGDILLAASGAVTEFASMPPIEITEYAKLIEKARRLLDRYKSKIILPVDIAYVTCEHRKESFAGEIPENTVLSDIGKRTVAWYREIIQNSETVFVNGTMGFFERAESAFGTKQVWNALGDTPGYTIITGGDSIAATHKYNATERINYICTGGDALTRFLSGEELPAVTALRFAAQRWEAQDKI